MKEYIKNLSRSEAKHRYWHVQKADRDFFPESRKVFQLEFHEKKYDLKVNHKDDIMTGQLYENYKFLEGDKIIITKIDEKNFSLVAKDTKPYPV